MAVARTMTPGWNELPGRPHGCELVGEWYRLAGNDRPHGYAYATYGGDCVIDGVAVLTGDGRWHRVRPEDVPRLSSDGRLSWHDAAVRDAYVAAIAGDASLVPMVEAARARSRRTLALALALAIACMGLTGVAIALGSPWQVVSATAWACLPFTLATARAQRVRWFTGPEAPATPAGGRPGRSTGTTSTTRG